jgi:hypothetical protein
VTTAPAPPPEKDPAPAPVPVTLPEKATVADAVTVQAGPQAPEGPPPIPTGFPEPPADSGPATTTDTGELLFPQPMKPAREGHVNLATVPPMTELHVPPLEHGGDTVVIDVYGTEVPEAVAERARAAARAAGLTLREL